MMSKKTFSKKSKMKILRRKEVIQKHTRITRNNGKKKEEKKENPPQNL